MMFLRSVVLRSTVIAAFASSLEHLVENADIKVHGATLENISQCPATANATFHHDGLQKDRRAEVTYHFNPPRDGCYLVEERTKLSYLQWMQFHSKKCEASANTKVHVHYGNGLQAVGTVDQTPKAFQRQPEDQWTYIAALPFSAGHPGSVTLSNEGTEPGTLTVFDQVRFLWSGHSCSELSSQPRRIEIKMTVDFQNVASRLTLFTLALKKKLAKMANIPQTSLRLTGMRSDSITAEFLVLPTIIDAGGPSSLFVGSATHSIAFLHNAISKNAAELCGLSGGPLPSQQNKTLEGCNIELKDLGFAMPSVQEGHSVEEKEAVKWDINRTVSDNQSESSFCYVIENASTPERLPKGVEAVGIASYEHCRRV
jgi:hypothetical protein